jgi:nucleoside-diphosphate-sugar epimerase
MLKVLVTGSSGLSGGVVIRTLGDKYIFSGLDRVQTADAPDIPTTVADVSNFEAIRPAFDGMDAVIHLAADADFGKAVRGPSHYPKIRDCYR